MDRKGIIILVVSFIMLLMWPALMRKYYPTIPAPRVESIGTNVDSTATAASTNIPELRAAATNLPTATALTPKSTSPEELLVVTSDEAQYTFTSHGGGLKLVELKNYPKHVSRRATRDKSNTEWASLNTSASLPVLALKGSEALQGDGTYQLSRITEGIRAEQTLSNGLVIAKEFRFQSNFLVSAVTKLENRSDKPLALPAQEWVVGAATPLSLKEDPTMLGAIWFDGEDANKVGAGWFANRTLGCFPGTPRTLYVEGQNNVNWVAVHNQFFALAVIPGSNAIAAQIIARPLTLPPFREMTESVEEEESPPGKDWFFEESDFINLAGFAFRLRDSTDSLARYLSSHLSPETQALLATQGASAALPETLRDGLIKDLNQALQGPSIYSTSKDYFLLSPLSASTRLLADQAAFAEDVVHLNRLLLEEAFPREIKQSPVGYQAGLLYPASILEPNETVERAYLIYAGPKEYKTLSRLSTRMENSLDLVMEFGFFGWFAKMLLLSMNGLHSLGLGYGMAIIAITIIIKLLFWPLTNFSTRSMKRMASMQPQIKLLQEKYKEEPQKMQRKMWEFYKENKINPASGCLPVMVQMPFFIGFFQMIRTAIELRGAPFLWISDLSQPDTLFIIPGFNMPFNLLPLLMGATMLWQARLTPVSPGIDPMQQKIMKYMPLMFLVILYNFSAGLTLYWTVQNLLSILQMKITRTTDTAVVTPQAPTPVAPLPKKKKNRLPRRRP